MPERESTAIGQLARLGFTDPRAAVTALTSLELDPEGPIVGALTDTADPDLALAGFGRLFEAAPDRDMLRDDLRADEGFRNRLLGVLGASTALAAHPARPPDPLNQL